MATIAGSVLAAYISFNVSASHLLTASVMSAPAALAASKLLFPGKLTLITLKILSNEHFLALLKKAALYELLITLALLIHSNNNH